MVKEGGVPPPLPHLLKQVLPPLSKLQWHFLMLNGKVNHHIHTPLMLISILTICFNPTISGKGMSYQKNERQEAQ